jgi:hypothetical protein
MGATLMLTKLRWILFLPAAVAISIVAGPVGHMIGEASGAGIWYSFLLSGIFSGIMFLYVSKAVAPRRSPVAKWGTIGMLALLGGLSLLGAVLAHGDHSTGLAGAAMLLIAAYAIPEPGAQLVHSDDITSLPTFNTTAQSASKLTVLCMWITFIALSFFTNASAGVIAGIAFCTFGAMAASLVIAGPLSFLQLRLPRFRALLSITNIAVTVALTHGLVIYLFAPPAPALVDGPMVIKCETPLPEFTLGPNSSPSAAEVTRLCTCIWDKLGTWEKRTAQALSENREAEIPKIDALAFPGRFGSALRGCGGMSL